MRTLSSRNPRSSSEAHCASGHHSRQNIAGMRCICGQICATFTARQHGRKPVLFDFRYGERYVGAVLCNWNLQLV